MRTRGLGLRATPGGAKRAAPLLALLLLSCYGDDDARPDFGPPDVPELSAVEDLRIDGHAADLVSIAGVAVGPDGTMALAQLDDRLIRFFGPSGNSLGSVGREGRGPGEFVNLFFLGWVGDSLTVYDSGLQRLTVLGPTGGFGRTVQITSRPRAGPGVEALPTFTTASTVYLLPDGRLFAELRSFPALRDPPDEQRAVFAHMDERGFVEKVVADVVERRPGVRVRSANQLRSAEFPFPNPPRYHLATDGSRVVVVEAALDGPDAGTYLVTAITVEGDTVLRRRYPFEVVEITTAYADSVIAARAARMEERAPRLAAAYRREAELPPMRPPVLSVLNGRDGTIWLRLASSSPGRRYLMLDADGTPLGAMSLPARTSVRVADRRLLWATVPDELGVQSLVRYRIDG